MIDLNVSEFSTYFDEDNLSSPRFTDAFPPERRMTTMRLPHGAEYVVDGKIEIKPGRYNHTSQMRSVVRLVKQCERIYWFRDHGHDMTGQRCVATPNYRLYSDDSPPTNRDWLLCSNCMGEPELRDDILRADYVAHLYTGYRT